MRFARALEARVARTALLATVVAVLAGAATGAAQEGAGGNGGAGATPPTPAPAATVPVIPVPEIATQAEQTTARLRAIESTLQPKEDLQRIGAELPAVSERISQRIRNHVAALAAGPALRALTQMTSTWQTERNRLSMWSDTITWYAQEAEREVHSLAERSDSWTASRREARAVNAPEATIDRVQETLDAIRDTRRDVDAYRAEILSLQDRVVREIATCDDAIHRIATYRKEEVGRIFVRDTEPLLGALFRDSREPGEIRTAIRNAARDELANVPDFFRQAAPSLALQGLLLVILAAVFRRARERTKTWLEHDSALDRASRVFAFPYSSALLVTAATSNILYRWAPHVVFQTVGIITLLPLTRIIRALVDPRLVPGVWTLAGLFVLDRVRDLWAPVPPFEQTILMIEMAIGIVVIAWMLRTDRFIDPDAVDGRVAAHQLLRNGARIVLVCFVISLVSGLLGYMRLAHVVGGAVLIAMYTATALFACTRALDGLVAYALRARPLRLLRMVRRHRPLLQARIWRVLVLLAAIAWAGAVAFQFEILDPILERSRGILTAEIAIGALGLSLGDLVAFVVTVWLSYELSRFLRFVLEEDVYPQIALPRGVPYAISSLIHYLILIGGSLIALAAMGLDLNRFTILAGALGVGVGFGLQNVVNNFVSGLILLFERPIQVGDTVDLDKLGGEVRRIGIRSSTVRTGEGAEVIVPNANLISQPVTNWTLTDRMRRIDLPVRVAYGSDPERVLEVLCEVVTATPRISSLPAPATLFTGFGENGLDFVVQAWTDMLEQHGAIRSELALGVYRALREAGIHLPEPQMRLLATADDGNRDAPVLPRRPRAAAERRDDARDGDGAKDGDGGRDRDGAGGDAPSTTPDAPSGKPRA